MTGILLPVLRSPGRSTTGLPVAAFADEDEDRK